MTPDSLHHITRFTYEFTSFQGWRLALCRQRRSFIRYFSDKQYGSEEAALSAALAVRELLLEELRLHPEDPSAAFERCRQAGPTRRYPVGLGAPRRPSEQMPH